MVDVVICATYDGWASRPGELCPHAEQPDRSAVLETIEHLEGRGLELSRVAGGPVEGHAAGVGEERREPHLDSDPYGRPLLGDHVGGHSVRQPGYLGVHLLPVGEIGLERRLPTPRPRYIRRADD